MKPRTRTLVRYLGAIAIVVAASLAADLFSRLTGTSRLTSIFLSSVLLAAFYLGPGPGYLAAAIALVTHLYLVDPPYKMSLGSIDEMNALLLFVAASVVTCLLAGRMRGEQRAARERARTNEILLHATRELSATADEAFIRTQLAGRLHALAGGAALVRDGDRLAAAPGPLETQDGLPASEAAEALARQGQRGAHLAGPWTFRSLAAGDQVFGVAGWRGAGEGALRRDEQAALELLIDTGAAAIARARVTAAKAEAESRARAEDLRNALLSSISHDLRTPLATIMGSASSLRRFADDFDVETRRDLAASVEEEASRLDTFVSNLLHMSRLQSGGVQLERIAFSVPEAVRATVERRTRPGGPDVVLSFPPGLPEALGDPALFEQALGNVFDNAVRYAGASGPVTIGATAAPGEVRIEVADVGPGVAANELERIFEKFFRAAASQGVGGTGLGLAISRGLMEGMGGRVSARRRAEGGLAVELVLPSLAT